VLVQWPEGLQWGPSWGEVMGLEQRMKEPCFFEGSGGYWGFNSGPHTC
jgi:hypothetical protein